MTDLAAVQRPDILAEAQPFIQQCGSCDAGLPMNCTCPTGDFRPVMARLVAEVERLRAELDPPNDIEVTGRCCCGGCVGMGPCDRDLGRTDD